MAPQPIRVLLVDDHRVVREGLRAYLQAAGDMEVVGEAADGQAALTELSRLASDGGGPDVVLMDLVMDTMDGIETTRSVKHQYPNIDVVAMTSFVDEQKVVDVMAAGATGYLLKDAEADEVAEAIRGAIRGEVHLDPQMAKLLMDAMRTPGKGDPAGELTAREREVLILVAQGHANKEIARRLDISERTARTHVSHILAKLGLTSRTQAALWAVREGLVEES
jgi:DNA-binding NarL/FixJ family response regulator